VPKKASHIVQVKVRMREDQRRRIERAAQKNGLTINAEILRRLDQSFTLGLPGSLEEAVGVLGTHIRAFERLKEELQERIEAVNEQAAYDAASEGREEQESERVEETDEGNEK
jgi:hypothetical protein